MEQFRGFTKLPPFWVEGSDPSFILGTDAVGRDMLSRLMYGARISLFIGLSVMVVSMVVGVALGLAAAFFGGFVDVIIIRVMDLIMAIPVAGAGHPDHRHHRPEPDQHHRGRHHRRPAALCAPGARLGA